MNDRNKDEVIWFNKFKSKKMKPGCELFCKQGSDEPSRQSINMFTRVLEERLEVFPLFNQIGEI